MYIFKSANIRNKTFRGSYVSLRTSKAKAWPILINDLLIATSSLRLFYHFRFFVSWHEILQQADWWHTPPLSRIRVLRGWATPVYVTSCCAHLPRGTHRLNFYSTHDNVRRCLTVATHWAPAVKAWFQIQFQLSYSLFAPAAIFCAGQLQQRWFFAQWGTSGFRLKKKKEKKPSPLASTSGNVQFGQWTLRFPKRHCLSPRGNKYPVISCRQIENKPYVYEGPPSDLQFQRHLKWAINSKQDNFVNLRTSLEHRVKLWVAVIAGNTAA